MTSTSDPATMRAIHAYNLSHYRRTPVQTNDNATDAPLSWMGATLIDTDGDEWLVEIANGDRSRLAPASIRMTLGR